MIFQMAFSISCPYPNSLLPFSPSPLLFNVPILVFPSSVHHTVFYYPFPLEILSGLVIYLTFVIISRLKAQIIPCSTANTNSKFSWVCSCPEITTPLISLSPEHRIQVHFTLGAPLLLLEPYTLYFFFLSLLCLVRMFFMRLNQKAKSLMNFSP